MLRPTNEVEKPPTKYKYRFKQLKKYRFTSKNKQDDQTQTKTADPNIHVLIGTKIYNEKDIMKLNFFLKRKKLMLPKFCKDELTQQ